MRSFLTTGAGEALAEVTVPTPEPAGSEVLLRTIATGICHSDVHLHDTAFDLGGGKSLEAGGPGMTLGHEIAGEVVATGPDAAGVEIGERFVVYPWIGCGSCPLCHRGDQHLCNNGEVLGIQKPGGFADHVLVPHPRYLLHFGDTDPVVACTCACSGLTAFSALNKLGRFTNDEHLVIIGAGGVGLNAVNIASSVFGIEPIVVDVDAGKRAAAQRAGAATTIDPAAEDASREIVVSTSGGAHAVIDFVGSEASTRFAGRVLQKGGRLLIVGLYGGTFSMPLPLIPMLERIVQGSYVGSLADMTELMELVRDGRIPAIPVDPRPASASAATAALDDLRHGSVAGRAVLTFGE